MLPYSKKLETKRKYIPEAMPTKYWLIKSEPEVFSIDDLAQAKNQTKYRDDVHNYNA